MSDLEHKLKIIDDLFESDEKNNRAIHELLQRQEALIEKLVGKLRDIRDGSMQISVSIAAEQALQAAKKAGYV